jgi:hypothetical protein
MPVILAMQEAEIRRITVQNQPGHIIRETLSRKQNEIKNPTQNRAGRVAQVVERLPSPEFKPSTTRKKKLS